MSQHQATPGSFHPGQPGPMGPTGQMSPPNQPRQSQQKKTTILLVVIIVLLVAVLALGGVFAWMFFGKGHPAKTTASKTQKTVVKDIEKWHKDVSFTRTTGNEMKVYGAFNAASDEYLLFTPQLKGSKITPLDINSGQETQTPYIVPTCKSGQYPLALKDGQIICNPNPAKEPENTLPKGYKAKISTEKADSSGNYSGGDKSGKNEEVTVTLLATPDAPKLDEKKKDFDAIKKFDFGNAEWAYGLDTDPSKSTVKFKNGVPVNAPEETKYLPEKTMYGYLNGDRYLDAYTISVINYHLDYAGYIAVATPWVWDPKTGKARSVQQAVYMTMAGDGSGKDTETEALAALGKIIRLGPDKKFVASPWFDYTSSPIILFKDYPVCLNDNTACGQIINGGVPFGNDEFKISNMDLRGAPFPDAPAVDKSKFDKGFEGHTDLLTGKKTYFLHKPGQEFPMVYAYKVN